MHIGTNAYWVLHGSAGREARGGGGDGLARNTIRLEPSAHDARTARAITHKLYSFDEVNQVLFCLYSTSSSSLEEEDTLKTDSFGFVLFMFVFVTTLEVIGLFSIRPSVYGEYVFVF